MTRRHGTAGVVAIVLIGLVGAALVSMTSRFTYDARRTSQLSSEAQLRQLLIAGAQMIPNDPRPDQDLPTPLGTLTILSITPSAQGEGIDVELRATLERRRLSQTVHLEKHGDKWTPTSGELAP